MRFTKSILTSGLSLIVISLIGCSPKILLKDNLSSNEIAVCTETSQFIPDSLKTVIDSVTLKFIEDYNTGSHKCHLIPCQNDSLRSLYINILRINVTDPGTQASGVVLTTIGAITPIVMIAMGSPIYLWFAYLPQSRIQTKMNCSKDISEDENVKSRQMYAVSGKYFGSYENQKTLLFNSYYKQLQKELENIENKYLK